MIRVNQITKLCLPLLLILLSLSSVQAQIELSHDSLDFGDVQLGETKTRTIKLYNRSTDKTYFVGTTEPLEPFALPVHLDIMAPADSLTIRIQFTPGHNVLAHDMVLIRYSESKWNQKHNSFCIPLAGKGRSKYPYYSRTFNLYDEALKTELKRIISNGYVNLGYTTARDKMYGEIDNVGGKVTCVYTGRSATFSTRSGANSNSFNTEHTWPQSLFNSQEPERADIHHLFPTDAGANSRRSNYPFALVTSPSWTEGGSKLGRSIFEPRDDHKGDAARSLFYFALRYQNYSNFLDGQEAILRTWSNQDQPSQKEMDRNDAIFKYQKNRSPFVDHPEFLHRITSMSSTQNRRDSMHICALQGTEYYDIVNPSSADSHDIKVPYRNCGNFTVENLRLVSNNGVFTPVYVPSSLKRGEAANCIVRVSRGDVESNTCNDLTFYVGAVIENILTVCLGKTASIDAIDLPRPTATLIPGTGTLRINGLHEQSEVIIHDVNGKFIKSAFVNTLDSEIPMHELKNGVYTVIINSGSQTSRTKVALIR